MRVKGGGKSSNNIPRPIRPVFRVNLLIHASTGKMEKEHKKKTVLASSIDDPRTE